jgi:putative glutamine amidotransferase
MSELRIGLTMREVHAEGYDEPRDALARLWGRFMQAALPEAAWLPVPNLGADSAPLYCERWGVNALILTGGEDIGVSPARDATERALWRHFVSNELPILGVCRGLQLMWTELGGEIERKGGHVAVRHSVQYVREASLDIGSGAGEVNSFHDFALREPAAIREPVTIFARAEDGSAEGVRFCDGRIAGVMWHPEREPTASPADITLVRRLFGLEKTASE